MLASVQNPLRINAAHEITAAWKRGIADMIESYRATGQLLIKAKEKLPHGEFLKMIKTDLPFGSGTAQRLMAIARDEKFANAARVQHLPPNWSTMYQLTKLTPEEFDRAAKEGKIHKNLTRMGAEYLVRERSFPPSEIKATKVCPEKYRLFRERADARMMFRSIVENLRSLSSRPVEWFLKGDLLPEDVDRLAEFLREIADEIRTQKERNAHSDSEKL